VIDVWNEISRDLWSHLQIEDSLVLSWGNAHNAFSGTLLDIIRNEREEVILTIRSGPL
jgi:hypothetical protein